MYYYNTISLQYLGLKYELETIPSTRYHRDKKTFLTGICAIFATSLLKHLSSYQISTSQRILCS